MDEQSSAQQIVPAPPQGLAVRSAAIVARGLRDLARDSSWLVKKIFASRASSLAVSPAGQACAVGPIARQGVEQISLCDIELNVPNSTLALPRESAPCPPGLPATFAYSPSARHVAAAWGAWPPEIHVFDLHAKMLLGSFGEFPFLPESLVWSPDGRYFAAGAQGGREARLQLWEADRNESLFAAPFQGSPASELAGAERLQDILGALAPGGESHDEGTCAGFGRSAFSPDGKALAAVLHMEGEWADDAIVWLSVPALKPIRAVHARGRITDLAWASGGQQVVFCSAGQAYRFVQGTTEPEALPFGAELCVCHPNFPLCLCFSSWLKNSAKGRLFLADLDTLAIFDEYPAEGVLDLRWSPDGSKAYAVTADGLAYIYEPSLL